MLDEVRDAGLGRLLVAGADPYPEAERYGPNAVDGLGDDAQPIVERGDAEALYGKPPALIPSSDYVVAAQPGVTSFHG